MWHAFSALSAVTTVMALTRPVRAAASSDAGTANPVVLLVVLGALALAPFVLIMLTSFIKISVVLAILRNALGTQQSPPNQVITGTALVLTIFIMAPVAEKMYAQAGQIGNTFTFYSAASTETFSEAANRARQPVRTRGLSPQKSGI